MGFALVVAGLLMIVTGGRGTYAAFGQQVAKDFTGPPGQNFTYWLVALGALGAVGYVPQLRTIARLFMVLVIIGIFLSNKGFFAQFSAALKQGPQAPAAPGPSSTDNFLASTAGTPAANNSDVKAMGAANAANQPGGQTFMQLLQRINPFGSTPAY